MQPDSLFSKIARVFLGVFIVLWVLAVFDIIDFHVCIKNAGHCKIIDPMEQRS